MIRRILVAYDGSDPALKAFGFGLDLAAKYQAEVRVIAVARPPDFAEDVETGAILEASRNHYQKVLAPLKEHPLAQGLNIHFEVAVGHPAEQIIRHAEQYESDLIVLGHRGKTFFERLRLGSVSKQVTHYAGCAVMVVR